MMPDLEECCKVSNTAIVVINSRRCHVKDSASQSLRAEHIQESVMPKLICIGTAKAAK